MKRHLKLLAGVAMLLSPIATHAADPTVKAPAAPVSTAVYNWMGLHVGVNGGWG
jgi:hypothetical protein